MVLGSQPLGAGVVTNPDQVAQRLVRLIRDPHGGEISAAEKSGQLDRITLVRLDPIARPAGIREGATTLFSTPRLVSWRCRGYPVGPASYAVLSWHPGRASRPAAVPSSGRWDVSVFDDRAVRLGHRHRDRLLAHIQTTYRIGWNMGLASNDVALLGVCFVHPSNPRCSLRRPFFRAAQLPS